MLPDLVRIILRETPIKKVRISSLGVEFVRDDMISLFANDRVTPYAHLSIQSGSDRILTAMNRHYTRDTLLDALCKLRNTQRSDGASIQIGADLIVGFPGEDERDFEDTLSLVSEYGVSQVHGFPFSPHQSQHSVPAGKFAHQIDEATKQSRLKTLIEAGAKSKEAFARSQSGKVTSLLVE